MRQLYNKLYATDQQNKLRDGVRLRVLRSLEQSPEFTQRDLPQVVGISAGIGDYVLKALVDKGLVKLGNFTANAGRYSYAYVLTPQGCTDASGHF